MMDEFEQLKAALRAAPEASATARATALAQAMQNFDRLHQTPSDRLIQQDAGPAVPNRGFWPRLRAAFSAKPVLALASSAAAVVLGLVLILPGGEALRHDRLPAPATDHTADQPLADKGAPGGAITDATSGTTSGAAVSDMAATSSMGAAAELPDPVVMPAPAAPVARADAAAAAAQGTQRSAKAKASENSARRAAAAAAAPPPADATGRQAEASPEAAAEDSPAAADALQSAPPAALVASDPLEDLAQSLATGQRPAPESLSISALINAIPYGYPAPNGTIAPQLTVLPSPWNPAQLLLVIGLPAQDLPESTVLNLDIAWDPHQIAAYRRIGSAAAEQRATPVAPGESFTAIYEMTPIQAPPAINTRLGQVYLQGGEPADGAPKPQPILATGAATAPADSRFAVAMAGFGLLLQRAPELGQWSWPDLLAYARAAQTERQNPRQAKALELMQRAAALPR